MTPREKDVTRGDRPTWGSPARISAIVAGLAIWLAWGSPSAWAGSPDLWEATAYCPCVRCTDDGDGITASGRPAQARHTVAVNHLPFGTVVRIEGQPYTVEDRGAPSHFGTNTHPRKRVDLFFNSHAEARQFGRRQVWVEVLP